jgi:hypothetical protein
MFEMDYSFVFEPSCHCYNQIVQELSLLELRSPLSYLLCPFDEEVLQVVSKLQSKLASEALPE